MNQDERNATGIVVEDPEGVSLVPVGEKLPATMFVFPMRRSVAFPNIMMPIAAGSARLREIVAKAEAHNNHLLLLTQKDEENEEPGPDDFHAVGVVARILKTIKMPDGTASVMVYGLRRAKPLRFVRRKPFLVVKVQELLDIPSPGKRAIAVARKLQEALRKVADLKEELGEEFARAVINLDQPEQLADFTGCYFLKKTADRQRILDLLEVGPRVEAALAMVLADLELAELGNQIQAEIRAKAEKAQKDYFLREQLKIIRRELGEQVDAREAEITRLTQAIEDAGMPAAAHDRALEELGRMRTTPAESPEYGVIRNYLDWLTALPWSKASSDSSDLRAAARVLDEDHFGLREVKERILEFLAVRKLRPGHAGSILCLCGPPGVGKTSLGRSIARATGREFWRFSLGGMRDEAEIKGHRRTYIGAMPGRILQGLKACGTNNPVLMLDEIDKLGSDFRGDPASALLEVLDPEQNHTFLDHYLDVPFDLSRVMFVATANVLPQIPEPLRDRMEVIDLPGYLVEEKVQIARRHLFPKQLERHGLERAHLTLSASVLRRIVEAYTREAGVRGLEKAVVRICRKAAAAVAAGRQPPGRVKLADLDKLLGAPRHGDEGDRRVRLPGVVQGLAWTPHGGDVLFIEASKTPGRGGLILTGSLGDVMSESVRIALSYLRSHGERYGIETDALRKSDFHVHFPAGAIPKDGPSAGIAITCALISLLTGRMCPSDLAMTGELTLVGEVLPIGGVREKALAAKRLRIRRVVLPAENRRDVDELEPQQVKGLRCVYVDEFAEVFAEVFGKRRASRRAR
jgi:ATP-dependent Lon protease